MTRDKQGMLDAEDAIRDALYMTCSRDMGCPTSDKLADLAVTAYLREANKLRPMSEAPEKTWVLVFPLLGSMFGQPFVGWRQSDAVYPWPPQRTTDRCRGWLPLPEPVEDVR